nr:chlorophyll synthase ChlG [Polymorphobacter sp.]
MSQTAALTTRAPAPAAILELAKPVTWFPPMWAFMCGVVSSGVALGSRWPFLIAGLLLTGPLVCGTSQAVNDWFDRHVDAINEPNRPIPSGRIPARWGLWLAIGGSIVSAIVASSTGPWVFVATLVGLASGWAYSAPPFRLKTSGIWGPAVCALSYEGLTWFTGASVMAGGLPDARILWLLGLYSLGAHGIMTLNDFKAVEGDRVMGIRSLPVVLGTDRAARVACLVMAVPQFVVVGLLVHWQLYWHAAGVGVLVLGQLGLMVRLLGDPLARTPWYNATGTSLYVFGMLGSAFGVGEMIRAGL